MKVLRRLTMVVTCGALVLTSACSEQITYRHSDGVCIEHNTARIFGVPLDQQESACPEEK